MDGFGHDKPGLEYTLKALDIARQMEIFQSPRAESSYGSSAVYDKKLEDGKAFTAWGLYCWLT
jgi:hypothetical protein